MNLVNTSPSRRLAAQARQPVVYVVDGDRELRMSLEAPIRSAGCEPWMTGSALEFLAQPPCGGACCLIVEKQLPDMGGLELQQRMLCRAEMPVIFMSDEVDVITVVQAMKAGAIGYFAKPVAIEELVLAIGDAIRRSHSAIREQAQLAALQQRYETLSRRERQVLNLVVAGRLNKQIGGELGISQITVKAHRGKMMRKMQACSFVDLLKMAAFLRRNEPPEYST